MTNLPITGNNSQLFANVASTAQKDGATNVQPADPFGAVLARQMDEANASASNIPSSATGFDTKTMADSVESTGKAEQDKVPTAASTPGDPSSALAVMLQLPQEIKASVAKDAVSSTTATVRELSAGKALANHQLVDNINASQANAKIDLTTAASRKSGAAVMAADGPALHSGSRLEITKSAELPVSLLSAAQGIAISTASMAASGITSGMPTYNKAADSLQTISSPLGSSDWPDEFSQKISWMSTQQNQVAELHLNPPNLGPLDVVLIISDNQATALFTSPHGAVRDAVENAMPKLREILADNGIMLGNTTVSDQSPRDRSAEGFMNQGSGTAAQRGGFNGASESTGASPATTQAVPARRHNGMVDTFA